MNNVIPIETSQNSNSIPLENRPDDQLMLLARGGMKEAFDQLVKRHQGRVLGIAMKYLGDLTRARDASQNSFLDLYRSLNTYEPQGKFNSFLARIIINQCRMSSRKRQGENKAVSLLALESHARVQLSDDLLLRREERRRVERAMSRLSPKLREVLILRFVSEMSYQEIGDTLNIRLGTVKSRIFSGIRKLHDILESGNR